MPYVKLLGDYLALKCSFQEKELAKEIQDGKWDKPSRCWLYPCNQEKLNRIKKQFPSIIVDSIIKEKIEKAENARELALKLKRLKDIEINLSLKSKPYKYQRVGVAFMLTQDRCMNFDEMGLGKCLMSIATAIKRKERGEIRRALIVCPASMKYIWKNEIDKHSNEEAMIMEGTKIKRLKMYQEFVKSNCLFLIINYELLRVDLSIIKDLYGKN